MKSLHYIQRPYEIEECTASPQHKPLHGHTFFELLFIRAGKGIQNINGYDYPYYKGDFFFITPMDSHSFEVVSPSRFTSIRFTKFYIQKSGNVDYSLWFKKLSYIFQAKQGKNHSISLSQQDNETCWHLMENIVSEHHGKDSFSEEIINGYIYAVMNMVARNIRKSKYESNELQTDTRISDIIDFITLNIYDKHTLTLDRIAESVNISSKYISDFFKKHTNISIRQFIIEQKMELAKLRLTHSNETIQEIAFQLEFTDDKHFTKTFKKYFDVTPTSYRKAMKTVANTMS